MIPSLGRLKEAFSDPHRLIDDVPLTRNTMLALIEVAEAAYQIPIKCQTTRLKAAIARLKEIK